MREPKQIRIDLEAGAAYVAYSESKVVTTEDVWEDGQVAADYDAAGSIIGIELLGFDAETLAHAKAFAQENALAFPSNLAGAVVGA